MLQLQIQLDTLSKHTSRNNDSNSNPDLFQKPNEVVLKARETNKPPNANSRAKTAPNAVAPELLTASQKNDMISQDKATKRTVNSSPALITLERVMQSFRARSQILAETLEENDNVLQKRNFGSTFDIGADVVGERDGTVCQNKETGEVAERVESEDEVSTFSRKGTFKIKKSEAKVKTASKTATIQINNGNHKENNKENLSNESKKQIRDLSINIK